MRSKLTALLMLAAILVLISLYYQYPAMLHLLPQGSHIWRQSDCMAMTQNYRQFHLPFLQPEIYNLQSFKGKVAGEFPVFYFIASKFENTACALRLIHTIIFLTGILASYFVAFYFLQRRLLSIYCSIFLFTSPLLVFYGNNFLSDVPALSFGIMGWAIFLPHHKKRRAWLPLAFLFFTFSALLKASEMINLALCFLFIIKEVPQRNLKRNFLLMTAAAGIIVLSWYAYARSYNRQNHDTYYFLNLFPVWNLSLHDIGLGIWRMTVSWSKNYFWRPASVLLILSSYFLVKNRKKLHRELNFLILISFILTIVYILLFYQKMLGHEYYYSVFYIFVLFGLTGLLKVYNCFHAENVFTHALIFLFLLINIEYCHYFVSEKLTDRYNNAYLSSGDMQDFLMKNGVTADKTVLSIPDDAPDITLTQIRRKGYTDFNDPVSVLKERKADYLLVANEGILKGTDINPYLQDSLGNFHGTCLYKLK